MRTLLFIILVALTSFSVEAADEGYIIVFLNKKSDAAQLSEAETETIMKGHMANMERLAKEGKLLAAGPFEGGGGIFIMKSTSVREVEGWISTDPGVQAKRWSIEIMPYNPRHGGVCPVKAPYDMVFYTFVRFDALVDKSAAANYTEIIKQHNEYVKRLVGSGNIITEAVFGDQVGGILVVKGELQKEVVEADPGVQQGMIEFKLKKLYIAKGSFCEQ
jgi:uncharacterized protein YciI